MKKLSNSLLCSFLIGVLLAFSTISPTQTAFAANSVDSITISPELNITRFAPYKILSDITGTPDSVEIELNGINGQISSGDATNIDYLIDGTPISSPVTKSMTYNSSSGQWETPNIYPDAIYPEVEFIGSSYTWFNTPSNDTIQKNNYQLIHFANPFTMVDEMSFFIEINATPVSASSKDLQVYIVEKGKSETFFNSDWRNSADVELVGTFNKNDDPHHTHTATSAHHLVALDVNADGTIGNKNLDVSDEFWIIVYSDAKNNNKGWDFRYHPSCDDKSRWYTGSSGGWQTNAASGCPDTHFHVARKNASVNDGVEATITADFGGDGTQTSTESFYFGPIPNIAPSATSFTSPTAGTIYDGNITVTWDPASDANEDSLIYTIYLLDENDTVLSTLISNTSNTTFSWDITSLANGNYKLKGTVAESNTSPALSTDFYIEEYFTINKILPTYTLSSVTLNSDNTTSTWGQTEDEVTLAFAASGTIDTPTVEIYSGGDAVSNTITVTNTSGNNWTATYTVSASDTEGSIGFVINSTNLEEIHSNTTDSSYVTTDTTAPANTTATPTGATYDTSQSVSLASTGSDKIRYTTDSSDPTCSTGTLYSSALTVNAPTTIKSIACDNAGNSSDVSTFVYAFEYTITFDGNNGSGHSPATKTVVHNQTTTLPSEPTRTGYTFSEWNTTQAGDGTTFDNTTVVSANATIYAQWTIVSYSTTYYGNGSNAGDVPTQINLDYGSIVTVQSENTLSKTGYTFYGWNTETDGSGTSYEETDTITIEQNLNLYAQWLENAKCNITFNGNGGSGHTPGTKTIDCDSSLSGSSTTLPTEPTQSGYTFSEWNTTQAGDGTTFAVDTTVTVNTTVYAQWTAVSYTLTFDSQEGTVSPSTKSVTYTSAVGELPTPAKTGYTFSEWNTTEAGDGTTYTSVTTHSLAADTTLYAQWTGTSYTLTFDSQGGTVSPSTKSVTYASAVGELPTPTKTGYTFSEWNTTEAGDETSYTSATTHSLAADTTLYAQWTATTYIIAFHTEGGSSHDAQTVTYASAVGSLPTSTKSGYTFEGWYTDDDGEGTQITASTLYPFAENYLLNAYWIAVVTESSSGGGGALLLAIIPNPTTETEEEVEVEVEIEAEVENESPQAEETETLEEELKTAIQYLIEKKVLEDYNSKKFNAKKEVNRAELVKMAVMATGANPSEDIYKNCFPDVNQEWYAKYICYAKEKEWIHGYKEVNLFKPGKTINKAEMLKIILNSQMIQTEKNQNDIPFKDIQKNSWFIEFAAKTKELGVLKETSDIFNGGKIMTKEVVAECLYRIMKMED